MNLSLMLILLCLGILAMFAGYVWNIVKGAQESVAWGVCLFLFSFPAAILFLVFHPRQGWKPFTTSVAGVILAAGSVFTYTVAEGELPKWEAAVVPGAPAESGNNEEMLPKGDLMEARERVMDVETHVASETAKLQQAHAQLEAMNAKLNPGDSAAVAAYNKQVESYTGQKVSLDGKRAKLASMQRDLEKMIDSSPRGATAASGVVIYTTKTCPACVTAKKYFTSKNIPFKEMDVQSSPQARAEWEKFNVRGVPVIVIKGQVVEGFNEGRIAQLL